MKELKEKTDKELMEMSAMLAVEMLKSLKDGTYDEKDNRAKLVNEELEKRGLKVSITRDFIHRIFIGDFDNCDGVEAKIMKV